MFLRFIRFVTGAAAVRHFVGGVRRMLAAADSSAWSCRAWQTDEGLPDNSVTGVAQSADGFLWVATYGGLMRFDGANFSTVPLPSLFKKSVRTMLLDSRGRLWLGMDPGSVVCLESNASHTFGTSDVHTLPNSFRPWQRIVTAQSG